MKKIKLFFLCISSVFIVNAQNNTFPSSGNVGVGTTIPDQKLTIKGGGIGFEWNSTDKKLYAPSDGVLEWMTHDWAGEKGFAVSHQGTKRVFLNISGNSYFNGGNLGIGTVTPTEALSISSNGHGLYSQHRPASGVGFGQEMFMKFNTVNGTPAIYSSIYSEIISNTDGSQSGAMELRVRNLGNPVSAIRIQNNGNVGIGLQNPIGQVSLKNQIYAGGYPLNYEATSAVVGQAIFNSYYGYYTDGNGTYPRYLDIASIGSPDGVSGGGNIRFLTNPINTSSPAVERMRISSSGNVGIGTTTPTDKLTVNGSIRAKKLIVTQNGWSDYVFAKNYKLRPLAEIENYIKANQHLPEVPSAKEVASKGINVGDTQALLLKKIEELTLYMIELKYENVLLKNRVKKLEFKNKK